MKKLVCIICILCLALCPFCVGAQNGEIYVGAKAAILIDADTKRVFFSKNEHQKLPVASTTKILTALLALMYDDGSEFEVSQDSIMVEGTSMGLVPKDRVTLSDLAVGMLALSGNDAANAAAVRISGGIDAFAELMNDYAEKLGMNDSFFTTPSGLDLNGNGSSAYDMSLLAAKALENGRFVSICSQKKISVSYNGGKTRRTYINHNKLLDMVEGCIGIKTGFTKKAGRCLVSAVERKGRRLICVTLNDKDDWNDHKKLYEYGFSLAKTQTLKAVDTQIKVVNSDTKRVNVKCEKSEIYLFKGESVQTQMLLKPFYYAGVYKGERVGEVLYTIGDAEILRLPVTADGSAHIKYVKPADEKLNLFEKIKRFFVNMILRRKQT